MTKKINNIDYKITTRHEIVSTLRELSLVPSRENGNISWNSKPLNAGTFSLIYSLKFAPPIDDHVKDGAIWDALNECARANDFSVKYFVRGLQKFLKTHASKSEFSLIGISQINCNLISKLPSSIPAPSGRIEIVSSLGPRDRAILDKSEDHIADKLSLNKDFSYVITKVRALDHRAALEIAISNIRFALGTLNIYCRDYGISKRFGYPNTPIGQFLTASPVFLIDGKNKKLGGYFSENYYPAAYKENFTVRYLDEPIKLENLKLYVGNLKRIDYQAKLTQAIILFQEGLEAIYTDLALIKFWIGIELICSADEKEASEKIIQRASSIFNNPSFVEVRLRFIQDFRNNILHKGDSGDHALLCAQWGSIILAEIICFCLFNKHKLRRHNDILQYMMTPTDREKLLNLSKLYRKRLSSLPR